MIKIPNSIEIKQSPQKGLGVFATQKICKDEVIEITPLIELNTYQSSNVLFDYRFYYPRNGNNRIYVVALGYGSLYNHSNQNNADWRDCGPMEFEFFATKDIEKGEEIFIHYGTQQYFDLRKINWL